jgi:putative tryptophan/tyrosine transport system substrate-binding protein
MQFDQLKRREFITLLGVAAAAWPLAARAQQLPMPVVGFLWTPASPPAVAGPAFRQGLNDTGFIEGQNVAIEYRFAEGQYDRLPDLLAELIRQKPMVIVAPGSTPAALAAKAATTTIPILFSVSDDPVKLGLVASLNRPHSNATGVNFLGAELGTKQLGLLRELLPSATRVGVLVNPKNPVIESWLRDVTETASSVGVQTDVVRASDGREIEDAFATLTHNKPDALLVAADPFLFGRRVQLTTLATRHVLPTVYPWRDAPLVGGLMSYSTSLSEVYRQVGIYTGRILKGAKPADLPVVQSTKFQLVINLSTAKALGLEVPPMLLARADEVIE